MLINGDVLTIFCDNDPGSERPCGFDADKGGIMAYTGFTDGQIMCIPLEQQSVRQRRKEVMIEALLEKHIQLISRPTTINDSATSRDVLDLIGDLCRSESDQLPRLDDTRNHLTTEVVRVVCKHTNVQVSVGTATR